MRIPFKQLALSAQLGAGSQGAIFRVHDPQDHGFAFPLIYKEFSSTTAVSGAALEVLANLRSSLGEEDRRVLDLRTVWPCSVVVRSGRVVGYVMQCIPDSYMQMIQTMSGAEPIPREVQHLFVADVISRKNLGEVPKRTERLALARQMAFALGFLHKRELVFGDVSYKNAVYTLRPRPMIMLLDCDAVRLRGQGAAVTQLNSPGWGAPEKGPQTIETDRYKLGLFILRCLTPGINAQNRDPDKAVNALDAEGLALLRRSLGVDPKARTSGRDWVTYLDARIAAAGGVRPRSHPAAAAAPPPRLARAGAPRSPGRRSPPATPRVTPAPAPPSPSRPAARGPGRITQGARPRPFGRPTGGAAPSPQGWVQPHRVMPSSHVRAASAAGIAGSSWATGAPSRIGPRGVTGAQLFLIVAWVGVLLFFLVAVLVSSGSSSNRSPTTSLRPATTAPITAPRVVIPAGASIPAGTPTPCPAPDGTAVRTTTFAQAPPVCIDAAKAYTATIVTDKGEVVVALDATAAPVTVNNFVVLARYHFYDGVPFHRVLRGFMAQTGDPTGQPPGTGGPGYTFADELPTQPYVPGAVAMAKTGPDANGGQFFIYVGPHPLGLSYSRFGQVTKGLDTTVKAIVDGGADADGQPSTNPSVVESVTITES